MSWSVYDLFNLVEGLLWWGVAGFLLSRARPSTGQQRWAIGVGAIGFLVFGVTDFLEIGSAGQLSGGLWGLKIACGTAIFCSRYLWRGWNSFRWIDREFLFGIFCLLSVAVVITLQHRLE